MIKKLKDINIIGKFITIKTLASIHNCSIYLAKKEMNKYINNGIVEKYHNRFYFLTSDFSNDIKSIQRNLINKAKINLEIARLLNTNFIYDTKHMVFIEQKNINDIVIHYPLCKSKIIINNYNINSDIKYEVLHILNRNNIYCKG